MKIHGAIQELTITPADGPREESPVGARHAARVTATASTDPFILQLHERRHLIDSTIDSLDDKRVRIERQLAELRALLGHYDALLMAEAAAGELPGLTDR